MEEKNRNHWSKLIEQGICPRCNENFGVEQVIIHLISAHKPMPYESPFKELREKLKRRYEELSVDYCTRCAGDGVRNSAIVLKPKGVFALSIISLIIGLLIGAVV